MAFVLKPDRELGSDVRRLARKQLGGAVRSLDGALSSGADIHEAVHDARKRCKKVRSMLRLVREAFPERRAENRAIRDAARLISGVRDATTLIESVGHLETQPPEELLETLEQRRREVGEAQALRSRVAECCDRLAACRRRAKGWVFEDEDRGALLAAGVARSYRRGRGAMQSAIESGTAEDMHDWRKRAKDLRYQLRLVSGAWPGPIGALRDEAKSMGQALGSGRDLALLGAAARSEPDRFGPDQSSTLKRVAQRQRVFRERAIASGRLVYAAKPKSVRKCAERVFNVSGG